MGFMHTEHVNNGPSTKDKFTVDGPDGSCKIDDLRTGDLIEIIFGKEEVKRVVLVAEICDGLIRVNETISGSSRWSTLIAFEFIRSIKLLGRDASKAYNMISNLQTENNFLSERLERMQHRISALIE